jgi:hypothetical protein
VPAAASLALVLLAARAAAGAAAAGCPADARVDVNLAAWRAALAQADTAKRRDELLADVKLALEPPEPEPGGREPRVVLDGVEYAAVQLQAGAAPDRVVQVTYRIEGVEDPATIRLVQVLRPLGGRAACALGDDLSRRDEPTAKLVTYALTFVPLLDAKARVIAVETVLGAARESETRRAYWTARGWRLQKIFDEATGHMRSGEGGAAAATTTTVGTIALAGGFPRQIELTELTKRGGCEVRSGDAPCEDGASPPTKSTFVFDGARYVRKR